MTSPPPRRSPEPAPAAGTDARPGTAAADTGRAPAARPAARRTPGPYDPHPAPPPDPRSAAAAAPGTPAGTAGPGASSPGQTPPTRKPAAGPYGPRPATAPPDPATSHPATPPPRLDVPDDPWDRAGPYARALRSGAGPLFLRRRDGWLLPLDVERWCGVPDGGDVTVLRRCTGPVLDIGCGPGRLVAALAALGRPALGVDVSSEAVAHARSRGAAALRRSVFEPLPGEGRWGTALLVDGNVGIGGDPAALLARAAALLRPRGRLVVEVAADDDVDERVHVHVTDGTHGARGPAEGPRPDRAPFPWARVGLPALLRYAAAGRWREEDRWTAGGRRFAALRAPEPTPRTARR
ncbi:class I SAM-dependent methyltransferase [Streptomyces sp. CMB-StM0423]|uniref:class I SAM-dependent methyltransferase n=1 Tax=Streptomyces sp. CMB-StM0423 TaxID=2059884 RepID=UPI001F3C6840|nr:class I SAM-dependent methyltransferase [Streptomyces sp. CMB-StM0423]